MGLLYQDTIDEVVEAACAIDLRLASLTAALPHVIRSQLPSGDGLPRRDHLVMIVNTLNQWIPREGDEAPLASLLKNARLLAAQRVEVSVFEAAIAELGRRTKAPVVRDAKAFYVGRVKQFYESYGYQIAPDGDAGSPTFYAWRSASMVSFIAVAIRSAEEAIASARRALEREHVNEPFMEGCVVLLDQSGSKDHAAVLRAGLRAISYCDLHPIGFTELESLVLRQHAAFLSEPRPAAKSDDSMALEAALATFLKGGLDRFLLVGTRTHEDLPEVRERVVSFCTHYFETKVDAPVPLALDLGPSLLSDLVSDVFRRHQIRFSPIGLPKWLEEGALLPIFTTNRAEGDTLNAVREALMGAKSKAVLIAPREDGLDRWLERRLRMPVMPYESAARSSRTERDAAVLTQEDSLAESSVSSTTRRTSGGGSPNRSL